jgi:hypothetical protein
MGNCVSIFRYWSGVLVLPGDQVLYASDPHVVELVIMPDTQGAQDFQSPKGGILLSRDVDGRLVSNYLLGPPDGPLREDLEFISRGNPAVKVRTPSPERGGIG